MNRVTLCVIQRQMQYLKMLPPRKISSSSRTSKQDSSPLQILLQMGFPKHRALKALAATGNRSVQLASDWLLTHVNDTFIDTDTPREYILYACPTGSLLAQLHDFWEKSKKIGGWNGAHNFPPHITLVSFFKAPDESSLQIGKAVKHVVEKVGDPPIAPLNLEPYISHNFMGLFVPEEHADYLKKLAIQYVKEVSSMLGVSVDTYEHLDALGTCFPWCTVPQEKPIKTCFVANRYVRLMIQVVQLKLPNLSIMKIAAICLEPHVKSLHITLAYHFDVSAYDTLKALVDEMPPLETSNWELRLYSRDPRFANHQVHKVAQSYSPKESDELELVLGDYVYIDEKDLEGSTDGWVQGTSWLTGVTGYLPAVYTRRTAESDAWTLHRAVSLGNNNSMDSKSESDSNTDGEVASYPHDDAAQLAAEKSEESYAEWGRYWQTVQVTKTAGILDVTQGNKIDWEAGSSNATREETKFASDDESNRTTGKPRRWSFALRHGERVDLTYGPWVPFCFDDAGDYVRKDLNLPLTLAERTGGKDSYQKDTPLTRIGQHQAYLVGEGLRLAGVDVRHVYASCALRCVETANSFLKGLQAVPSVKIRVEPGLFEYKYWHLAKGMAPFMTPVELHEAGFNVDLNYKPYVEIDIETPETVEEYYKRGETAMQAAVRDTEAEGGNIMFVGHAATLDMMVIALQRLSTANASPPPYQISKHLLRVPYCALGAVQGPPWRVVPPPCPPSINSSSGRFDWKLLRDLE